MWMSALLLQVGDAERNPGPCDVCVGALTRTKWLRCGMCGKEFRHRCLSRGDRFIKDQETRYRRCTEASSPSEGVVTRDVSGGSLRERSGERESGEEDVNCVGLILEREVGRSSARDAGSECTSFARDCLVIWETELGGRDGVELRRVCVNGRRGYQ